jgi:subtilase family serine protease
LVLAVALAACGGHSSLPTTLQNAATSGGEKTALRTASPMISVPRTFGRLAFTDIGRRSPNAPVNVAVVLRYNHQAELDALIASLSTPGAPHHFLTQAEFNAQYAPTAAQESAVVRALQSAGFHITRTYSNHTIVDATAPSAKVEKFFSTQMHTVSQGKFGERYLNAIPASVPSAISSYVLTASLSNVVIAHPRADITPMRKPVHTPTPAPSPTPVPTATPVPTPTPVPTSTPVGGGCNGAPADNGPLSNSSGTLATGVAKPFDFPVQHGCNGAGQTIAIAIDLPGNTSYVNTYLSASGVTRTGTTSFVAVDGGGSGDEAEADLDQETIAGLAPGANIIVYDMGSLTDQAIEDTYNRVLTDGKASVVNSSFGGCESSDPSFESATNSIAQQGAATGVTFVASSGDSGSVECGRSTGVSAPAGDPYFTSIGGVDFTYDSNGVLTSVTAGNTSCANSATRNVCASGGGVSTLVPFPSWQNGIAGMITTGRNQPDISLPFFPVAVFTGGSWGEYLGTSWSSPAFAALVAETNELHGTKTGWMNQTLYSLFAQTGYSSYFTPCTSGNNIGFSCNASQYNQVAGIGVPKGWALANAL